MNILSLKSVLLYQLGKALLGEAEADAIHFTDFLYAATKSSHALDTTHTQKLIDWYEIPLKKKHQKQQNTSQILYVSAAPQAIAASSCTVEGTDTSADRRAALNRLNQSHSNLQTKLTNKQRLCSPQISSIEAQLWLEFEIETQKVGWITFKLTEKGVNQWLKHLCKPPSQSPNRSIDRKPDKRHTLLSQSTAIAPSTDELLWLAQYTYARCSQLESMQPHSVDHAPENGRFEQTACDRRPCHASEPWQNHPAIISLVHALVDTSDSLFWIPYQRPTQQYLLLLKCVVPLCQAFERFHRNCLCGFNPPYTASEIPASIPKEQASRLISATKNVLEVLLEGHLGERAPKRL